MSNINLPFDCGSVSDYTPLTECLNDKIVGDYHQLLDLVQKPPKTLCCEEKRDEHHESIKKVYREVQEADPNVTLRLCKLSKSLLSFLGCNKDDYLLWKLCTLYGRVLECDEKRTCTPFSIVEPDLDYRALSKVSFLLGAIQQDPDTNITFDSGAEVISLLFKTLCATSIPQIGNIMNLILIAVTGCKAQSVDGSGCAPNSQIFSSTAPVLGVANGPQTFPCGNCVGQSFSVYVTPTSFNFFDPNVFFLLPKLKVFGFLMMLAFEYLCDFTVIDCLCIEQILASTNQQTPGFIMCGTDPAVDPVNLWQYAPAACPPPPSCSPPCIPPVAPPCPDPPVCQAPSSQNNYIWGVNPLGDALIAMLKKLYCSFTQSICDNPCPDTLFEFLIKYSPQYNNSIQKTLCLKPILAECLKKC